MSRPQKEEGAVVRMAEQAQTNSELKAAIRQKFGQLGVPEGRSHRQAFNVLDQEKRAMIVTAVRMGNNIETACGMAQVSVHTVKSALRWAEQELQDCEQENRPPTDRAMFWLKVQNAQAWFLNGLREKYEKAMDKDPRAAGYYLELLSRLHRDLLGRSQVLKLQQDHKIQIEFVETTGAQWQSGQSVAVSRETLALPPGVAEGNEIIDAEINESEDDNDF